MNSVVYIPVLRLAAVGRVYKQLNSCHNYITQSYCFCFIARYTTLCNFGR